MLAYSSISAEYLQKFEFLISKGIVATCLRWGGRCHMGFVAIFIRFPAVQKFWKSVKIWQSYREFTGGNFFLRHSVHVPHTYTLNAKWTIRIQKYFLSALFKYLAAVFIKKTELTVVNITKVRYNVKMQYNITTQKHQSTSQHSTEYIPLRRPTDVLAFCHKACMWQTDGHNYNSQDRASITASCGDY